MESFIKFFVENPISVAFLIPILGAMFKNEVGNLMNAWYVYRFRRFDNRDPDRPDECQLFNPATGQFEDILIDAYIFHWKRSKRGVFIRHILGNDTYAAEKITLVDWPKFRKRHMPKKDYNTSEWLKKNNNENI